MNTFGRASRAAKPQAPLHRCTKDAAQAIALGLMTDAGVQPVAVAIAAGAIPKMRFDRPHPEQENRMTEPVNVHQRVAIVTGAGGGLGRTYALEDVRDHLGQIRNEDGYVVPTSIADKMAPVVGSRS